MQHDESVGTKLRHIILNTRVPIILPRFQTNWQCFDGSLADWCQRYDQAQETAGEALPVFERMQCAESQTPQWERKRKQLRMTTRQFLEDHEQLQPYWTAYHYKRAADLPAACTAGIDFSCFGFAEHQNDYTFWLGSRGANTPCHFDTFGVNVVVQVYGSKSWLLFPPDTPLQSTRIPYEESSVYCLENFYAPAAQKLAKYEKHQAYHCQLEPGDVLVVPRHWWHYVEALETSLSVNYWVPLESDLDLALDELLVKHLVESFVKGESDEVKRYLLNPNQLEEIAAVPSELISQYVRAVQSSDKRQLWPHEYLTESELSQLVDSLELPVQPLAAISKAEYTQLLASNAKRSSTQTESDFESSAISSTMELLINSICAPQSIASIKREFFQRLRDDNN